MTEVRRHQRDRLAGGRHPHPAAGGEAMI